MSATTYLNNGIESAINGDWPQAENLFCRAIELQPDYAEAYYNLGLAYKKDGRIEAAESCICQAIKLKPDYPEAFYIQGLILCGTNRLDEAALSFYKVTQLRPSWADAYFQMGTVLKNNKRLDGAEICLRHAIELKSDFAEAYNNLGLIFSDTNRLSKALICFHQAIELNPDYSEAYNNLGVAQTRKKLPDEAVKSFRRASELQPDNACIHNNLGLALKELKRQDEAKDCFWQAIRLNPGYAEAYLNLGLIVKEADCLEEAEKYLRQAIELKPDFALAYNNLAGLLTITNRLEEAEICLRQSIRLKSDSSEAHRRLGIVLKKLQRLDEAEAAYFRAIELSPPGQAEEARYGLGTLYLLHGQLPKAWKDYELRRKVYKFTEPAIRYWQGENLADKKILLFFEQGLGDTIQFVRYAHKVAELAAETTVRVQKPLQRLLSHSFGCKIYAVSDTPSEHYDFACSLHSLPFLFNTSLETIPQPPYIRTLNNIALKWRKTIDKADGGLYYRVGVVWAGNPRHDNDRNRSIPFKLFSQLFKVEQISWVSLQVGKRAADLTQTAGKVIDFSRQLGDFQETAGLIQSLDLVITVDSSVAHLAGAMGKKTWILLPFAPDWRWQLNRDDSPWYPTAQLFRQHKPGAWQDVLERVKTALQKEIHNLSGLE